MNVVTLIGRLGQEPDIRYSAQGSPIANFSLALNEAYTDSEGNKQEHVNWIPCKGFNRIAEVVGEYLTKGMRVGITGSLRQRTWEDDNANKRSVIEVVVRSIDFLNGGRQNGEHKEHKELDEEIPF